MGSAIASHLKSDGLDWSGCVEIAENAMEHDLTTIKSLFTKLNKNGYIPQAVVTNFKRSIDVYFVYDFAKDEATSFRGLIEFNQSLVRHGLVTSLLPDASRRSAINGFRHRIENSTLIVFCLTRRYVNRVNDHTQTFPCQSEFHYLSSRKSFLKLFPVVFESIDDEKDHFKDRNGNTYDEDVDHDISSGGIDWNIEVCEGPVAVLLGGRSTWSHWPVQRTDKALQNTPEHNNNGMTHSEQKPGTSVQGIIEKNTVVPSVRYSLDIPRPLPLHELAREGLARQVFHACVRAFVDNAHRAILLQVRYIIVFLTMGIIIYDTTLLNQQHYGPLFLLKLIAGTAAANCCCCC